MVVNFRARGISRGARKLVRTPLKTKKKKRCIKTLASVERHYKFLDQWHHHHPLWIDDV
jgi:hypothetical protein